MHVLIGYMLKKIKAPKVTIRETNARAILSVRFLLLPIYFFKSSHLYLILMSALVINKLWN